MLSMWIKLKQMVWKDLLTTSLFAYICTKEGAGSLHISIKNHDTQAEKGKFIYKALTLPCKQLILKCDPSQSHKSAV